MARFRIRNGQTRTTELTLNSGDSLFLEAMSSIVRSGGVPAVGITAGTNAITITNRGRIAVEGANGAAIRGLNLGLDLDVLIRNGAPGVIEGEQRAIELTSSLDTMGSVQLVNAGRISGGTQNAVDFDNLTATTILVRNDAGGVITNNGSADVLRPGNDDASRITVINEGVILAGDTAGANENGDAVDLQSRAGGLAATIVNRGGGRIEGGKHGVTGANAATINNLDDGRIIGRNGSGLNFDTTVADGDGSVVVRNFGLISGRYDGLGDGDGDGVDVDFTLFLRNFGRIEGLGADEIDDFADGVAAGGGYIFNGETGEIFGATNGILIDDGERNGAFAATRLINEGSITADTGVAIRFIGDFDDLIENDGFISSNGDIAIDVGGGDDLVVNDATVIGDVILGDGADEYRNFGTVTGVADGGEGNDDLAGGDEGDRLAGGLGADTLTGGEGADSFFFRSTAESTTGSVDTITDFTSGDAIVLTEIDADSTADGDQMFDLIGSDAFSGVAGELRVAREGGDTLIQGDTDGDRVADLVIRLSGQTLDPSAIEFAF